MASSITQSVATVTKDFTVIKFACIAHTDGLFSPAYSDTEAYITQMIRGMYLYKYQVVAGATGPTAASDFTVKDHLGVDILGGQGTDGIPNSGTNEDYPKIADQAANQPVVGTLRVTPVQQAAATASATFDIYLYFKKAGS